VFAHVVPFNLFLQQAMEQAVPSTFCLQLSKRHPTSKFSRVDEPCGAGERDKVEHILPVLIVELVSCELAGTQ